MAELGSVTRAAEAMTVAPSAVSRRLRDMEARLGAQLLTRTTRRMSLTEAGRSFLDRCRQILADLDEAEAELACRQGALEGSLRLAAPLAFGGAPGPSAPPTSCRHCRNHRPWRPPGTAQSPSQTAFAAPECLRRRAFNPSKCQLCC